MVTRYGMDDQLGNIAYEEERPPLLEVPGVEHRTRAYSEATAREIDCAVRDIVGKAFRKATETLSKQRRVLDDAARALLEKETLSADDLTALRNAVPAAA